jgi:hypothetical protein
VNAFAFTPAQHGADAAKSERPPIYRFLAVFLLLAADLAFGFLFAAFFLAGFLAIHLFLRNLMIAHQERVRCRRIARRHRCHQKAASIRMAICAPARIKGSHVGSAGITNTNMRNCKQFRMIHVKFSVHRFDAGSRQFESIQKFSALDANLQPLDGNARAHLLRRLCSICRAHVTRICAGESLCANHRRDKHAERHRDQRVTRPPCRRRCAIPRRSPAARRVANI